MCACRCSLPNQWARTRTFMLLGRLSRQMDVANPTLDKTRRVMSLVYKHGQRYGLLPRNQESNPMRFVRCKTTSGYEAMILTPNRRMQSCVTSESRNVL